MQQTLKRTSLTLLISGALGAGAVNSSLAAEVPAGVQFSAAAEYCDQQR